MVAVRKALPNGDHEGVGDYWVLPALKKFAKMRYAPGTPAGNSRNHEKAVKI
jgi:hypothetical protein